MTAFSEKLREMRKKSGLKVKEVLERLKEKGVKISDKTLYNWETGERKPDADEFVVLCRIYGVKSFKEFDENSDLEDENEKSPAPEGTEDEDKVQEVVQGLTRLLEEAGWIPQGADLTDAQFRTIASYVIALNFYFKGDL